MLTYSIHNVTKMLTECICLGGMRNLHDKPSKEGKMWSFKYFFGAGKASFQGE